MEHRHHNRRRILGCTPLVAYFLLGQDSFMQEQSLES